jgi:ubiquinone/menaquinone biosynthesis C-methylase UbiE
MEPAAAYDLWSSSYDREDNLLVTLDDGVFGALLSAVPIEGRSVLDVGCGTGRHWQAIRARSPSSMRGVDASSGMLAQLRRRYPDASVELADGAGLRSCADASIDVVVSTLALGHFSDLPRTIAEWSRVLRPGGDLLLTDLHPEAAARGGCTFAYGGKTIAVTLHAHSLAAILRVGRRHGLTLTSRIERRVDHDVRGYFEARGQTEMFRSLEGVPLIYGLRMTKESERPR